MNGRKNKPLKMVRVECTNKISSKEKSVNYIVREGRGLKTGQQRGVPGVEYSASLSLRSVIEGHFVARLGPSNWSVKVI